jgi:hypothetical protein
MAVKLDTYDSGLEAMDIDTLCHSIATNETPADARKTIYIPTAKPIIDGYDSTWFEGFLEASRKQGDGTGSLEIGKEPCVRPKDQ